MSDLDFNDDFDADLMADLADDERKARREDAQGLPPVRLDPKLWMPPLLAAKVSLREADPAYDAYRTADRAFRRAFGRLGSASRRSQVRTAHALAQLVKDKEQS